MIKHLCNGNFLEQIGISNEAEGINTFFFPIDIFLAWKALGPLLTESGSIEMLTRGLFNPMMKFNSKNMSCFSICQLETNFISRDNLSPQSPKVNFTI